MKNIYIFLFFVLFSFLFKPIQSFGQIDTRFWFAAPDITSGHGDNPIYLRFSALDKAATVVISMPKDPTFPVQVVNLAAFATGEVNLTPWINLIETPRMTNTATGNTDANRNYNNKFPNGILVESTTKITAYYEVGFGNNPDIFALKGKNGLGTDFWIPMQTAWANQGLTPNGHAGFVIVATEDNTKITISTTKATRTFSATGASGTTGAAQVNRIIYLDRGEAFNVATQQPTAGNAPAGSHVISDKPIAITLFHDSIKSLASTSCYDLAGDQLVPTNIVGKEYIVMRGLLGEGGTSTAQPEKVYILATQNGTTVNINRNGATLGPIALVAGQQHVFDMDFGTHPQAYISSTKPVYVLHMSGYGCETGAAILPPIDCTGSRLVQVKRSTNENFTLTLLVKTGGENKFTLGTGLPNTDIPASAFSNVVGLAGWKSARISLTTTQVANLGVASVKNSTTLFHLGVTNGGITSGCRYGYFSSFNSLNLGPDISIFYGSTTTLDAETFGAVGYLWNTGDTSRQITVNVRRTKDYIVRVDLGQCFVYDTICVGTIEYVWVGDYKVAGVLTRDYGDFRNWSAPCGQTGIPDCNQDIVIPALVNGVAPESFPIVKANQSCRNIIIEDGANITINPNRRLDVCGDMVHAGKLFMPLTSQLQFIGKQPQTYTRTATGKGNFENLIINNQTTLDPRVKVSNAGTQNMVVSKTGSLTFTKGILRTEGDKEVVVHNPSPTAISGFSSSTNNASDKNFSNFIGGKLRRAINTLGGYNFPVGLAVENIGVATTVPTKQAIIANSATWIQPTGTNSTYCNLNPFTNNHVIYLSDNSANVSDPTARKHIQFPSSVAVLGDASRTMEAWVSLDPSPTNGGAIFYMGTDIAKQLFALKKIAGNNFQLDLGGGLTQDIIYGSPLTSTSTTTYNWHHFAMTYNGSSVKVYIDGTVVLDYAISNLNTTLTASTLNKFFVGRYRSNTTNTNWYLAGKYDNIRIWNEAKTQAEISTNSCVRFECTIPPDLIGNYDLEDGSGVAEHKIRNCSISPRQYERAKVEFQTPITDAKYLLAFFNLYPSLPVSSPNEYRCQATFGTCPVLNHGFWTISAYADSTLTTKVAGNGNYRMTLYNNAYTNAGACGSPKTLIMKRATSADPWSIPTFPTLCYDNSLNSTAMEYMTGFSDFGVPMTIDPVILPVDLISLSAKPLATSILVEWKTVNEIENSGFEVWRSTDSQNFAKVGWVAQNSLNVYEFEDREVTTNQMYYYHLKQIDNNGNAKMSKVVNAKIDGSMEGGISIYPNPTENNFTIDLGETYTANSSYQIEIYTSIGMLVKSKTSTNSSKINMSLDGLAKGMYLIKVTTPSRTKFIKLQKE